MSVSDNSTLRVARDNEGDGHAYRFAYGVGDLPVNTYDKSPYTDTEIISLDVGPTQTRYRVHRAILLQSPELDAKPALKLWGEKTNDTIPLPELDETTAHTLVHYLYTGRYQTLKADEGAISQYKLSTCVYCAAIRYKLSGLAELAKEKITSFGEDLTILDILGIARENAFPLLPEDEAWFPAYLDGTIKAAVSEDPLLFTKSGFSDQIEGDRRFKQVMVQAIVNSYSQRPVTSSAASVAPSVPEPFEESHDEVETIDTMVEVEPVVPAEKEPIVEAFLVPPQEPEPVVEAVPDEPMKLDEIEPTLEEPVPETPEPFTDELGSYNSKTYQRMGSKKSEDTSTALNGSKAETIPAKAETIPVESETIPVESETIPVESETIPVELETIPVELETAPAKLAHTRNDSVMQVEQVVPAPIVEKRTPTAGTEMDRTASSPPIVDGTNGNSTPSKKSKKKKGKKTNAGTTF